MEADAIPPVPDPVPIPAPAPTELPPEEALILRPDILRRFDFAALFGNTHPVELELGAGDGSFLVNYTTLHPERNFLGAERLLGRLRKIDRKGRRAGLNNLRVLRLEAAYLLEWMVPAGSLDAIHIYFPDPWPKRRHWKNRLVNERFTHLAHHALKPGGTVYLRTDDLPYFEQMERVFAGNPGFLHAVAPDELLAVKTDFERSFNAQGIPTNHATFRRLPGPALPLPAPDPANFPQEPGTETADGEPESEPS
ncbi:MAG TPA: tRNA (guanosine(46)-N7)-methyltransferase TrmB [Candidatus Limnocylindria bacterium]|nr:tRNA (guanosine(46)-N7)-methyltransferase TrmB [Candidatus Limnocylindria bacterium]